MSCELLRVVCCVVGGDVRCVLGLGNTQHQALGWAPGARRRPASGKRQRQPSGKCGCGLVGCCGLWVVDVDVDDQWMWMWQVAHVGCSRTT
jgi:hypothetical protein